MDVQRVNPNLGITHARLFFERVVSLSKGGQNGSEV